ncbi:LLM class flavin-dependent oxidoreductase, partial [Arthrobacter deserti]|nr:LLM class flavin-dependent oxidoreductase [Arthrobacter deserti]
MEVIYKLLEGSWEDDAVIRDTERSIFTDPAKVHEIGHEGKYFKVPGIAITEPSPQRTPVIFQAGTSKRGLKFAAENAEAVFVTSPTKELLKATVARIRDAAEAAGRGRYDVRIYAMQTVVTGPDSAAAQAKFEEYKSYAD